MFLSFGCNLVDEGIHLSHDLVMSHRRARVGQTGRDLGPQPRGVAGFLFCGLKLGDQRGKAVLMRTPRGFQISAFDHVQFVAFDGLRVVVDVPRNAPSGVTVMIFTRPRFTR